MITPVFTSSSERPINADRDKFVIYVANFRKRDLRSWVRELPEGTVRVSYYNADGSSSPSDSDRFFFFQPD
jgi:hypothetical protein